MDRQPAVSYSSKRFDRDARAWLSGGGGLPKALQTEYRSGELRLRWGGVEEAFSVTIKYASTPKAVRGLIHDAPRSKVRALLVLPYLSERVASDLLSAQISALDLGGNYQIVIPGRWLLQRLDRPNRFPASAPIRDVFNGASSLVARALLTKGSFPSAKALQECVEALDGSISKGTVSKVLKTLEHQLWIQRRPKLRVTQAAALLDAFTDAYRQPSVEDRASVKLDSLAALFRAFNGGTRTVCFAPERYVVEATGIKQIRVYTEDLRALLAETGLTTSDRFATAELLETKAPGPYFDPVSDGQIRYVSRLEVYLQLAKGGKRERQAVAPVRKDVLAQFGHSGTA